MSNCRNIVNKVIEGFEILANCRFDKEDLYEISAKAEDLLFNIYDSGVSRAVYNNDERKKIGYLVPSVIQIMEYQLSVLVIYFGSQSIDTVRIQRSGLQFLIDDFKDFPKDESHTLEKTLKDFFECEGVAILDELLKTAVFDFYSDDFKRDSILQAEIAKLPENHWWFTTKITKKFNEQKMVTPFISV